MTPNFTLGHNERPADYGVKLFVDIDIMVYEVLKILHQNILHHLHVTNEQYGLIERENSDVWLVTVLFIYLLKLFANIHFLERTILKIAYKRCGFYIRDTEFVPKLEVSNEIEIQGNKNCRKGKDKNYY